MNSKFHFIKKDFSYQFSFTIQDFVKDWSLVRHHNLYLTAPYLRAIENSQIPYLSFLYVIVYQREIPVGVLYFQNIEITNGFYFQDTFPKELKKRITTKMLKSLCGNLLVCGNFFATGENGFALHDDISSKIVYDVLKDLKSVLKKTKNPLGSSFTLFKEFWGNQELVIQQTLDKKYHSFEIDVNMVLSISNNWHTFQEYLGDMTTKYRTRAKSVYKKTESVKAREFSAVEIKASQSLIHELYVSVVNTASFNMVKFTEENFYQFKKELKENFVFTGYFLENALVAFSTACFTDSGLDANYVGINYQINKSMPLYQRILYDYVQLAITNQVKELRLGRTAELMKSSLGAEPVPMKLYIKHDLQMVNTLIKPLVKKVKPSTYELRSPFKKD
ncbi:hypothetical protein QVZ41_12645 [Wenyingzhuangia sp. chi5]|uniref:GNAT family N-acetyltransferase n=1 Tax=Wenyingzhuangia gilva TaxID=3057677 RepID=A0ABT8VUN3_9FLAO|nr:hypothetical protein [Wenyingzhuangia sp. chi5]MDO3695690.1 hypothetical protein [Wenyingzhuangia sp. chi5]